MLQRCLTHSDKFRNVERLIQAYFLHTEPRMLHSILGMFTWMNRGNFVFKNHMLAK